MAASINKSITKWKFYGNENLEEMSFISVNFSTLFYKRNRKLSPTLKGTRESAKRISYRSVFYAPLVCLSSWSVFSSSVCTCHKCVNTNIYFCQLLLSNVEFQQRERWDWDFTDCIGAPKLREKEDDTDFQVFLSEIWKHGNNWQAADYALTISRLLKNCWLWADKTAKPINQLISNKI